MALLQVKTENGLVEGLPSGNQSVSVFKGIPYAKPPVGPLRWKAPQPVENWEGVYQAYKFSNICPQPRFSSEGGNTLAATEFYVVEYPLSEDCLYLNVWTPAKSPEEKLPVAVYIHGGGFETGYGYLNAYDGEGFGKRGIVMVTFNYRLNVFGFLAHPELAAEDPHGSTGNYGTMDQAAAIQWVKRNIAAFGGDPEKITIFGQSAGGCSVQNMCACPLVKGDFQRAIMQSGGGLSRGGLLDTIPKDRAWENGRIFLEMLGVASVEEARQVDAQTLVEKFQEFKKEHPGLPFSPCVDGYVLPEAPAQYFLEGKHPELDTMVGCTADEMRHKGNPIPKMDVLARMAEAYEEDNKEYLKVIDPHKPAYCAQFFENRMGDDMLAGDIAWCENQLALGRKPAYAYYFTYVPPGAEASGAHHSVEHHFVFQTLLRSQRPYTGFDFELSNELADYWANFIKTGNPNSRGKQVWKPYGKPSARMLEIGKERKMIAPPGNAYVKFMVKHSLKKKEQQEADRQKKED